MILFILKFYDRKNEIYLNDKLIMLLVNGRNFEKLQNQADSIYLLVLLIRVLAVEEKD